jgi:7-keto-8-aminopelargonate synthetase-like enzyme
MLDTPSVPAKVEAPEFTGTAAKALDLLGQNIEVKRVCDALGVTESYISQLREIPEFAAALAEKRYQSVAKHNETDNAYDKLESKLLKKLDNSLVYLSKPTEIVHVLSKVNSAIRRGASAPATLQTQSPVIQLMLPQVLIQNFGAAKQDIAVNTLNQVTRVGDQSLVTMQSSRLKSFALETAAPPQQMALSPPSVEIQNEQTTTRSAKASIADEL